MMVNIWVNSFCTMHPMYSAVRRQAAGICSVLNDRRGRDVESQCLISSTVLPGILKSYLPFAFSYIIASV
ncbi:hypothetical protein M758_5G155000 [Ceratodon purpureus]|nr:hypothetical protein M758_5G155000 [Ceratodon purpureus]